MTICRDLLEKYGIEHQYIEGHEPVLDYEAAKRVDEKYHLEGVESKCILCKTKSDRYVLLCTVQGKRINNKNLKAYLGEKASLTSPEDLLAFSTYQAGCAAPFGYPEGVLYIIDPEVLTHEKYICSAGIPCDSFVMKTKDLEVMYKNLGVTYEIVDGLCD